MLGPSVWQLSVVNSVIKPGCWKTLEGSLTLRSWKVSSYTIAAEALLPYMSDQASLSVTRVVNSPPVEV